MSSLLLSTFRRILRVLPDSHRGRFFRILGLLFLNSAMDLLSLGLIVPILPLFLNPEALSQSRMLQGILAAMPGESPRGQIVFLLGLIVGVFVVRNVASLAISRAQSRFAFDLFHRLSTGLQRYYFRRGYLTLQGTHSAEIANEISTTAAWFAQNLVMPFLVLLNEWVVLSVLAAVITVYAPQAMLWVALFLLPPSVLFYVLVRARARRLYERLNELGVELKKLLTDFIFGYPDVKTTSTADYFLGRYSRASAEFGRLMSKNYLLNLIPSRILEVALVAGAMVIVAYGLFAVADVDRRVTLLGMFVVAAYRVLPTINRISMALLSIRGHQYTLDAVEKTLELGDARAEDGPVSPIPFQKAVTFRGVTFRYPRAGGEVVRDLDLEIRKGEFLGVVGPSGGGKTTFLHLLLGLLAPTAGRIEVDGAPLTEEALPRWHRWIGYVQQEVYLLDGTLADNVAFGVEPEQVDRERLERALRLAQLQSFVSSLPKGVDTTVGERGAAISVGQKQRIGIARAIYGGAEVLVLDEITSALDAETERQIGETIRSLHADGFTIVLVAHRPATLRHCERVIELSDGRVARTLTGEQAVSEELARL
jgi:ABC-type multidrug transport system fused ATPase/permease subunit